MGRRTEWRVPFAASVRVAGISHSGQPYRGTAQTLEISRNGVRVGAADFRTHVGDVVTLSYRNRCARYRVIWIVESNGPEKRLVGLNLVAGQPHIWGVDPGAGEPDTYHAGQHVAVPAIARVPPPTGSRETARVIGTRDDNTAQERRSVARFDCDRAVVCWGLGSTVPVWGKLQDLSSRGCSVETPVTFEVGARLRMELLLFGVRVRVEGEVRRNAAHRMGVQLTSVHRDDYKSFQTMVARLGRAKVEPDAPIKESDVVVQQINAWFEERDLLSRDDLRRLLGGASRKAKSRRGTHEQ